MLTDVVKNHEVLELGSGAGFLGLIIATLQMDGLAPTCSSCSTLVLSDGSPEVLFRCQQNFRLPCSKIFVFRHIVEMQSDNAWCYFTQIT